jgi:hypothetical protein
MKGTLFPLRREKVTSPANAWELCSRASKGLSPLRREKVTSPANAWELCSRVLSGDAVSSGA